MASSPSSSDSHYDVFISFRGQDTLPNFTSHLKSALSKRHVSTFCDENFPRGHEISSQLLKAIESSEVSIIIFSKNYAESSWCLDELVKIMECKEAMGQTVIPIFYHVDPSDVRKQKGSFGEAFGKLKEKFKGSCERVHKWTLNLTKAASLSGWDSNKYSNESELCEVIARHVEGLCPMSFATPPGLFGVNSIVKKIISDLHIGAPNVLCIGIMGIGGIGKTTVANLVYKEIYNQFDLRYFFPDVRKQYDDHGKVSVREKFYSKLEFDTSYMQGSFILPTIIPEKLSTKKVLVVLDDVSESDQLDDLGIREGWFGEGSRVIVTSRDKRVFNGYADVIHPMEGLDGMDAVELFKSRAFHKMNPEEGHMRLIDRVVDYCKGLPLALKVLGSHLCSRTPKEWEIELSKLKQEPEGKIMDVLKISYDSLTSTEKAIFLDIACCFKGWYKDWVMAILDACGFPSSEHGLMRLEDKCLITIEDNELAMHDLIEEMGKQIAQEQGSRLFNSKEICRLLRNDTENNADENYAVEVICFNMEGRQKINLHPEAFLRLHNLRILMILNGYREGKNVEFIVESDQSDHIPRLPRNLRVLYWPEYPFKSLLPSRLYNLVELNLSKSNITQLWQGDQYLENLKTLNLSYCPQLISLPNLSSATNLISINLTRCESLQHLPSMVKLESLKTLNLSYCRQLISLPNLSSASNLISINLTHCESLQHLPSMVKLESLETLLLHRCSSLKLLPDIPTNIKELVLDNSGVEEWPLSTFILRNLYWLSMKSCKNITKFPSKLDLNFTLDPNFTLPNEYRNFYDTGLDVSGCTNLQNLPKIKGNVRRMLLDGTQVQELPLLDGLSSLEYLCFDGCSQLVTLPSLHDLSSLHNLSLDGIDIVEIPNDIASLSSLIGLRVKNCNRLECLPKLPQNLKALRVTDCTRLEKVESTSYSPVKARYIFNYVDCVNLDKEERSKMMLDAHHFIKKLAIAPEAERAYGWRSVQFSIPGSEIPEWVMYQSQEPSSAIGFPQKFFNTDNLLGFAFYMVLGFANELSDLIILIREHNFAPFRYYSRHSVGPFLKSDHVCVFYLPKPNFDGRVAFAFIPAVLEPIPKKEGTYKSKEVKKLGVMPIYKGEEERTYNYKIIPLDFPGFSTGDDSRDDSNAQEDSIDKDLSDEEDDIIVDDDINDKEDEEHDDDDDNPLFLRILLLCSCFKKKEKE